MSFSFCFSPMRRAALFALDSSFLAALSFAAGNAFSFLALWYSLQAMLFSFLPFVAFGTGEGLLRYGIRIRCSKQAPGVRDAFSEAFGAKNRLLRYGRDIRCAEQPSVVRGASWIFGTAPLSGTEQDSSNRKRVSLALYATETTWQSSFSAWLSQIPHNSHPRIRRQCDNT